MFGPDTASESADELYETAPCGYVSTLPDGTIVRVNQTFLAWTGHPRRELLGKRRLQDLLTVGGKVFYETHVAPLLRMQGSVREVQLEVLCADGRALPVLVNTVQKDDAGGQPVLLRSTIFDITDRKRFERELIVARNVAEGRARRAALNADLARALTRRLDLGAQLRLCAEALVEHLDVALARIWTVVPDEDQLLLEASAGVLSVADGPPRLALGAASREASVAARRQPLRTDETTEEARGQAEEWIRREGVAAYAGLPLSAGGRLLGVLAVHTRAPLEPEEEQALGSSAAEIALGIDRVWAERERDLLLEQTRLQAEELRQSREVLRTTLLSIGDAVMTTDAGARTTFLNPVAEALTGWTAQEALGVPVREIFKIVNETTRAEVESPVDRALQSGQVVGLANDTSLIRKDGSEVGIDDSAAPIRGAAGEVTGVVLVFRDVSEQRRVARELRNAQIQLSTVVKNAPLVLLLLDARGHVLVSEGKGLAALDPGLAARSGLSAFAAYAHVPWLLAEFRRALAGEAFVGGGELEGRAFETHHTPTRDEAGQLVGIVSLVLDITERRRHEETIEKTIEFEQQLIGIVSHDLRNPLSTILMSTALVLRSGEGLPDKALRIVSRIQSSADRAQRLIRDLLDFTQARLGDGIPIQRKPVDLAALVQAAVEESEAAHPGRVLTVEHEGDCRGEWDGDRLNQVVTNLTTNALKYSPADTRVGLLLRDEGEQVSLAVHNQGAPIAPEHLGRIFQPMRRATGTIDSVGRSVGLGLYIVKQIVESHGGQVDVRSDAASGTTFRVRLPRKAPAPAPTKA